jgi:hypothetical protein
MTTDRNTVETILSEARVAVEAADLPQNLRPIAFEKAVELLSGTGTAPAPAGDTGASTRDDSDTPPNVDTSDAEAFVRA